MKKVLSFTKGQFLTYLIAVFISVFFVAAFVFGATTIGDNISTDGNLTVTGTTGLTGLTTLVNASTTVISTSGDLFVGGNATTTGSSGNFATEGTVTVASTLAVTGASTLTGNVGIATSTPAFALGIQGDIMASTTDQTSSTVAATTTLFLHSESGAMGGCIQMKDLSGAANYKIFLVATTTNGSGTGTTVGLVVEAGTCKGS